MTIVIATVVMFNEIAANKKCDKPKKEDIALSLCESCMGEAKDSCIDHVLGEEKCDCGIKDNDGCCGH